MVPEDPGAVGSTEEQIGSMGQCQGGDVERPDRGVRGVEEPRPGAGRGQQDRIRDVGRVRRSVGVGDQSQVPQSELAEHPGSHVGDSVVG